MKDHLVKKIRKNQKKNMGDFSAGYSGPVGMNKSWRSIYKMEESRIQKRKGFVVSQTVS